MSLISLHNISVRFGVHPVLDDISLQVLPGQRVCLLGRNGEGKSTLMKVLSGELEPDSGEVSLARGMRTAMLGQDVPEMLGGTVFTVAASGLGERGEALAAYHDAASDLEKGAEGAFARLERAQQELDATDGWEAHRIVETVLSHLSLEPDAEFDTLSGGLKRRALLARALACDPDLLLLDEPTNHLDIASVAWLEDFLLRRGKTLFFVTHDRMLLRALATRILELDRGALFDWSCDYDTFLARKEAALAAEDKARAVFDKKLAEEETWIRRGLKARRTRNMGRVRALRSMRRERAERRERTGKVSMSIQEAGKSGKLVAEASDVTFSYNGDPVVRDFSTVITRGDRIGVLGPNGAGKTTLLKLLMGELEPNMGTVRRGVRLEPLYFDQLRGELDLGKDLKFNVAGENDFVDVGGRKRHVVSWLKDFLFEPERIGLPVSVLSGGEKNRLLLAKLFARPSNLLILDEPTNDLDMDTLELLEDRLAEYEGTVLLVSHDRAFLNNVVVSTLAFEGGGKVVEYAGGYDDWFAQRPVPENGKKEKAAQVRKKTPAEAKPADGPRKLTFGEKRERDALRGELEELPGRIERLENRQSELHEAMADPELYKGDGAGAVRAKAELDEVEQELETLFERWSEAESRLEELCIP